MGANSRFWADAIASALSTPRLGASCCGKPARADTSSAGPGEAFSCAIYPPGLRIIITAITKPRMTMVSGIANSKTAIADSSGFSVSIPEMAGPILDWAHAVHMAGTEIATAAARYGQC
jgi:hypothetical protein